MKKTLLVLALATVLVFAFATVSSAAYKSYSQASAYLSWGGANAIASSNSELTTSTSPHGGYTTSTVKCAVCHSTHRAWSASTQAEAGVDNSLLAGSNSCGSCHATWGANSAGNSLVEMGNPATGAALGPHFTSGNCMDRKCHGNVHMSVDSKYATVAKFNLAKSGDTAALDADLDAAIAAGNVNESISTTALGRAMKAYTTGYVCAGCHGASSFSIATPGVTNKVTGVINMVNDATDLASAKNVVSYRTGHPSVGHDGWGIYVPSCETCHDVVGVATKTTAWPHANRGIDVYKGRYDEEFGGVDGTAGDASISTVIATDNTDATRYGLWMTSGQATDDGAYGLRASSDAQPIVDAPDGANTGVGGYSLRDGACLKCHVETKLP